MEKGRVQFFVLGRGERGNRIFSVVRGGGTVEVKKHVWGGVKAFGAWGDGFATHLSSTRGVGGGS